MVINIIIMLTGGTARNVAVLLVTVFFSRRSDEDWFSPIESAF